MSRLSLPPLNFRPNLWVTASRINVLNDVHKCTSRRQAWNTDWMTLKRIVLFGTALAVLEGENLSSSLMRGNTRTTWNTGMARYVAGSHLSLKIDFLCKAGSKPKRPESSIPRTAAPSIQKIEQGSGSKVTSRTSKFGALSYLTMDRGENDVARIS
jgi:hypothetical protein